MIMTIIACVCSFLFGWGLCKRYYKINFLLATANLFVDIILHKHSDEELEQKIKSWKTDMINEKWGK